MATALIGKADAARLKALADQLAQRDDAGGFLIQLLKLWAGKIPVDKPEQWTPVRLRLGQALLSADRPAEAAGELGAVHAAMVAAGNAEAKTVWLEWMKTLLAADDISAATRIAEAGDADFAAAYKAYAARLEALRTKKDWDNLVRLASAGVAKLAPRLTGATASKALSDTLAEARTKQRLADRQKVSALLAGLLGSDEPARATATQQLLAMKSRATLPLAEELRKIVAAETPDANAEAAVLKVLTQLDPKLTGYDATAPAATRLAVIDAWLKKLGA